MLAVDVRDELLRETAALADARSLQVATSVADVSSAQQTWLRKSFHFVFLILGLRLS